MKKSAVDEAAARANKNLEQGLKSEHSKRSYINKSGGENHLSQWSINKWKTPYMSGHSYIEVYQTAHLLSTNIRSLSGRATFGNCPKPPAILTVKQSFLFDNRVDGLCPNKQWQREKIAVWLKQGANLMNAPQIQQGEFAETSQITNSENIGCPGAASALFSSFHTIIDAFGRGDVDSADIACDDFLASYREISRAIQLVEDQQ